MQVDDPYSCSGHMTKGQGSTVGLNHVCFLLIIYDPFNIYVKKVKGINLGQTINYKLKKFVAYYAFIPIRKTVTCI